MEQIEILKKLGMVVPDGPELKEQLTWEKALEALAKNPSPKAQALYLRLRNKYQIDGDKTKG